jgi:3-hydroxypropanoate dehydrogenase
MTPVSVVVVENERFAAGRLYRGRVPRVATCMCNVSAYLCLVDSAAEGLRCEHIKREEAMMLLRTDTANPEGELSGAALDQLFREARTYSAWLDRPVRDDQLRRIYDLMKWGPTSANSSPGRTVFLRSRAAKERLAPALAPQNVEQTLEAPVTAIVAYDLRFYDELPRLYPHAGARSWFVGNEPLVETTAFRNGSLQGAYLILAARALGLDAGPMSGFDNEKVDREFFPDGRFKSNFLVNLGYGDRSRLHPRSPRLAFEKAVRIL